MSVPSAAHAKEADYFGIASGRDVDKFAVAGLTAVQGEFVDAPYVGEFPLVLECKLLHTIEIGLHTQFIGEIMDVKADESVLGPDGLPDMDKVQPFVLCRAADVLQDRRIDRQRICRGQGVYILIKIACGFA